MAAILRYRNETILAILNIYVTEMPPIMVREEMLFEEFQGGCHGRHLGYWNGTILAILNHYVCLFVLRFYGPVNPMGSCRARSVYLTTRLLGRLSPLSC